MKMKKQKYAITYWIFIVFIYLGFSLLFFYFEEPTTPYNNIISKVVVEGNTTYNVHLENYYDVEYKNTGDGLTLKITNPCIVVRRSRGLSMKPYWENNTLGIFDTCFPKEELEIGDVIAYRGEWNVALNPHHRIIDIDYNKRWVQTQGDNPITNTEPDDFVGFDRIIGKEIGVLNVLDDKKIVKKEVLEELNVSEINLTAGNFTFTFMEIIQTCVCTSNGILRICDVNETRLFNDTFIKNNDFREEYCI